RGAENLRHQRRIEPNAGRLSLFHVEEVTSNKSGLRNVTKSPAQQFLEITDQNGGNLTEQDAAKIESLLLDSRCQGTEDWVVAAHFLTGHYFSKLLSGFNYGRPDN